MGYPMETAGLDTHRGWYLEGRREGRYQGFWIGVALAVSLAAGCGLVGAFGWFAS